MAGIYYFSPIVFLAAIISLPLLVKSTVPVSTVNSAIVFESVERTIDISSQLSKVSLKLTIANNGKDSVNSFLFAVEPIFKNNISFISGYSKTDLEVHQVTVKGHENTPLSQISLKELLKPGQQTIVDVKYVLIHVLKPFPPAITQNEKQYVQYTDNHYVYSPYKIVKQTTTVNVGTRSIESYSKLLPTSLSKNSIVYGPYSQIAPFSNDPMVVHYENNSPFLSVTYLERTVEVSHWGNIAVEESIDLLHTGAQLKGPFSRFEYSNANNGLSSVKKFKTFLPASASKTYYRDEIGNISTSNMKVLSDSVELDIRTRFPLFGGWKTHYIVGYNVPSYEYLYNSGDEYKLKMRIVDHVFNNMIVEEAVTKIILPEGSCDISLSTPFPVKRLDDDLHYTYLDTKGRPVVAIKMNNLLENHIQDFELSYSFPRLFMLHEPLLVVLAFYLLFLCVIIYVRLDFSITSGEEVPVLEESELKASSTKKVKATDSKKL